MEDNTLRTKDTRGGDTSPEVGKAAVDVAATGLTLPSVAALPEAFERYPNGGEVVAWLFVAWLLCRIAVAWINSLPRK